MLLLLYCTSSYDSRSHADETFIELLDNIDGLHGSHVGGQKQYIFSPLGNNIYFHAKLFHCFCPPMAVV